MNIWEKFEGLPPLERIVIVFTVTALLLIIVYRIDKRVKLRRRSAQDAAGRYIHLEQKPDGTLVAYIAFWRYLFFGLFFAAAFCICINILVHLYRELPSGFWKRWDEAGMMAFILLLAISMPLFAYGLLKNGYKKVQLEIDGHRVRYLRSAIRGGILLSDSYVSVPLEDIMDVALRKNLLGGGVIIARTATQTHSMILLLSQEEQEVCCQKLQEASRKRGANQSLGAKK